MEPKVPSLELIQELRTFLEHAQSEGFKMAASIGLMPMTDAEIKNVNFKASVESLPQEIQSQVKPLIPTDK